MWNSVELHLVYYSRGFQEDLVYQESQFFIFCMLIPTSMERGWMKTPESEVPSTLELIYTLLSLIMVWFPPFHGQHFFFFSECVARFHQFVFISCGLFCSLSVPSLNFYEAFLTPLFNFFLTTPRLHSSKLYLVCASCFARSKDVFPSSYSQIFLFPVPQLFTRAIIILLFSH